MAQAKLFKKYSEQINILKQRGVIIQDDEYAMNVLSTENYYIIVNGYKDLFIENTQPNDHYKKILLFKKLLHCIILTVIFVNSF